jgi:ligand-binding sensor domain-containing protein
VKKVIWLILLIQLLSFDCLQAQHRAFKNFTEEDGLPSSTVYSVFEDSQGYIWIATDNGVSRYNGYEFENFNTKDGLADYEIFDFFEDSKSRIWFYAHNGKLSYYHQAKFYNEINEPSLKIDDSGSFVSDIAEDASGTIWISLLEGGVYSYNSENTLQKRISVEPYDQINGFFPVGHDEFVMLYRDGAVYFSNIHENITETDRVSIEGAAKVDFFYLVKNSKAEILANNIIYFNVQSILYSFDIKKKKFKKVYGSRNNDNYELIYNVIKIDNDLWVCTAKGAFIQGNNVKNDILNELINFSILSITKDSNGNYWIATKSKGLLFFPKNPVYILTSNHGLTNNSIKWINSKIDQNLWAGDYMNNVNKINITKNLDIEITEVENTNYNKIEVIDDVFFGCNRYSLIRKSGRQIDTLYLPCKDFVISEPHKTIHIASPTGYFTFTQQEVAAQAGESIERVNRFIKNKKIDKRVINLLLDSQGNIWLVTINGLFVIAKGSHVVKEIESLAGIGINNISDTPFGGVMLATKGYGLVFLNSDEKVHYLNKSNGLSNDSYWSVKIDDSKTIWAGSNSGLDQIVGFPDSVKVSNFNQEDGLSSNVIYDIDIRNDTLWAATGSGINFFDLNKIDLNNTVPPTYIEKFKANNIVYSTISPIALSYTTKEILIQYIGVSPASSKNLSYRYRLTNSSPWVYTPNRSVNLSSLSPGAYSFEVSAKNKSSEWSKPAVVNFKIEPPFWNTKLFYFLAGLTTLAFLWLGNSKFNQRKEAKRLQEERLIESELKSLKAQINPHFLSNALNSIQGKIFTDEPELAHTYLVKLGRLTRQILDYSDVNFVGLDEEIELIENYLDIERLKTGDKFTYEIHVDTGINRTMVEVPTMVVQPFLENAIWHGFINQEAENKLSIRFELEGNGSILIVIADNGIGREASKVRTRKTHESMGNKLVIERLNALNYYRSGKISFRVEDAEVGTGTVVKITIPQN